MDVPSGGDLSGVTNIALASRTMAIYGKNGATDVLGDSADIELKYGTFSSFSYRGSANNTAPSVENINSINLNSHGIVYASSRMNSGTYAGQLVLTDSVTGINRGADGKGTMFLGTTAADGSVLTDIVVQNGYAANTRLPWGMTLYGSGIALDANKVLVGLPYVDAPTDVSTWVADQTYVLTGTSTLSNEVGNITIKSLGVKRNKTETLTIADGNTLTLSEGLFGRVNEGGATTLYLKGGKLTSSNGELYIYFAQNNNVGLFIYTEITGDIDVILAGASDFRFEGTNANTYTGTTYVNAGTISARKPSNVTSIPGDLVIGTAGVLEANTDNQINSDADIMIRDQGRLAIGDSDSQTFNGVVTLENGTITLGYGDTRRFTHSGTPGLIFNGGEIYGTRTDNGPGLHILTDVRRDASANTQSLIRSARQEAGYFHAITLSTATTGPTNWTWDIEDSLELAPGLPEMLLERPLYEYTALSQSGATVQMVNLTKDGTGAMHLKVLTDYLTGTNTVNDGLLISDGGFRRQMVQTGIVTNGSPIISGLATTAGLEVGQRVHGYYSSYTAYIVSIDSASQVTVNGNTYANTGNMQVTFWGGSGVGRGPVNVNSGATFGGDSAGSTVNVNSGGTVDPGNLADVVGSMTAVDVIINSGADLKIDINSTDNDEIIVWNDFTLDGNVSVELQDEYSPEDDAQWVIATSLEGTIDISNATTDLGYGLSVSGNQVILSQKMSGTLMIVR